MAQQGGVHGPGYQLHDGPAPTSGAASTLPLNVRRDSSGQPDQQSPVAQPAYAAAYGASPYQPGGPGAAGPTSPSHDYGNLPNQFAGLNVGQNAYPAGSPGVGASA